MAPSRLAVQHWEDIWVDTSAVARAHDFVFLPCFAAAFSKPQEAQTPLSKSNGSHSTQSNESTVLIAHQ